MITIAATSYAAQKFNGIHLKDTNHHTHIIDDLKSPLTLVHFWATWCSPCIKELPALITFMERQGNNRSLILIAADSQENTKRYLTSNDIEDTVLVDQYGKAMHEFNIKTIPTTLIYNREGMLIKKITGAVDWQSDFIEKKLNALNKR